MAAPTDSLQPTNPATGEPMAAVPCTSMSEIDDIVARARAAQPAWATRSVEERGAALMELGRELEGDLGERLARTMGEEMGKPIRHARSEIKTVTSRIEGFIDRARAACTDEAAREGPVEVVTQWRPLGVAAVIAPWNFPISTPHNLVASALLTGNGVVLKPSELTPRCGAMYCESFAAHLPEGVLGLVQGRGNAGARLVASDVDMVAFTGSVATGQAIMREAAGTMKRLVLEMGGKDPMIVLPGADLDAAARHAVQMSLWNTGQVCVSVERVLVHHDVHDELVRRIVERAAAMRPGDPADESTNLGPMASSRQRDLVLDQLEDARAKGARMLLEGEASGPGWYLGPSVVDGVDASMRIASDETFGPVVAIQTVANVEEAVRSANETMYGLGASVWGEPGPQLDAVADRIEAGMVGVNRGLSAAAGAPWVGWKMSGFGYTRSTAGMRQFLQPRTRSRNV